MDLPLRTGPVMFGCLDSRLKSKQIMQYNYFLCYTLFPCVVINRRAKPLHEFDLGNVLLKKVTCIILLSCFKYPVVRARGVTKIHFFTVLNIPYSESGSWILLIIYLLAYCPSEVVCFCSVLGS